LEIILFNGDRNYDLIGCSQTSNKSMWVCSVKKENNSTRGTHKDVLKGKLHISLVRLLHFSFLSHASLFPFPSFSLSWNHPQNKLLSHCCELHKNGDFKWILLATTKLPSLNLHHFSSSTTWTKLYSLTPSKALTLFCWIYVLACTHSCFRINKLELSFCYSQT
jgi:hypothetical protein